MATYLEQSTYTVGYVESRSTARNLSAIVYFARTITFADKPRIARLPDRCAMSCPNIERSLWRGFPRPTASRSVGSAGLAIIVSQPRENMRVVGMILSAVPSDSGSGRRVWFRRVILGM